MWFLPMKLHDFFVIFMYSRNKISNRNLIFTSRIFRVCHIAKRFRMPKAIVLWINFLMLRHFSRYDGYTKSRIFCILISWFLDSEPRLFVKESILITGIPMLYQQCEGLTIKFRHSCHSAKNHWKAFHTKYEMFSRNFCLWIERQCS